MALEVNQAPSITCLTSISLAIKSTGPSKGARKATVTVDSNVSTVTVDIKSQAIKENAISAATPSLRREIQTLEHKLAEKEREVSSLQQQSDANRQMLDIYEQLVQLYQQLNETHAQQRGTTARVFAQLQQQMPHDGDHDVRAAELLRQLSAKRQELERLQPGIRPTVSDSVVVVVDAGDVEDDTTGNGDDDGDGASWEILSLYKVRDPEPYT